MAIMRDGFTQDVCEQICFSKLQHNSSRNNFFFILLCCRCQQLLAITCSSLTYIHIYIVREGESFDVCHYCIISIVLACCVGLFTK